LTPDFILPFALKGYVHWKFLEHIHQHFDIVYKLNSQINSSEYNSLLVWSGRTSLKSLEPLLPEPKISLWDWYIVWHAGRSTFWRQGPL